MALDRFGIQLEALTRGEADLNRLEALLNKVGTSAQRAGTESATSVGGVGQALRDGIQNPAAAASQAWEGLLSKLGTTGVVASVGVAAIGALASATYGLAKAFADTYEQQANNAMRLGVTIQQYGVLAQVSKEAGLSQDVLVGTMRGLSKALADGSEEGSKQTKALKELGISARDSLGVMRPMQEVIFQIADRLGQIRNPAERAALAITLLGRSGLESLPLMTSELRKQVTEVERTSIAYSQLDQTIGNLTDKTLDRAERKFSELWKALKGGAAQLFLTFADPAAAVDANRQRDAARQAGYRRAAAIDRGDFGAAGLIPGVGGFDAAQSYMARAVAAQAPIFAAQDEARKKAADELARKWAANKPATVDQLMGLPRSRIPGLGMSGIDRNLTFSGFGSGYGLPSGTSGYQFDRAAATAGASIAQFEQQERLSLQALQAQIQLIQLMAGPGGELQAARDIRDIRLATAKDVIEAQQANLDYTMREAQIRKALKDEGRQTGVSIFDSLLQGGAGAKRWGASFGLGIGRTAFANLYGETVGNMTGKFSLPGIGTAKAPTFLGKVLQGTPFGADPMAMAAGTQLGAAQIQMQAATTFAGAVGGFGVSGAGGGLVGSMLGMFGGGTASGVPSQGLPSWLQPQYPGVSTGGGALKTLGYVGGAAAAGFGVYSGIKMGGAGGALTAAGAGLAGLAMIPGPQQPFLAAAAMIAGTAAALIGSPKTSRAEALRSEAARRAYADPTGMDYAYTTMGDRYDYNRRGETRVFVEVKALDSQSFIDHAQDIGEAVRHALGSYQPLVDEVRSTVLPGA